MRILLIGKNGQVGWELQRSLAPLGEVIAVDYPEVDFMELKGLRNFTLETKPDLIVNAAAYTEVDKAESEPEIAMTINGEAPEVLAEAAKRLNAGLVHYSTDYVFDGTKGEPYTEEDEPNPINEYGRSKLAGDLAIQASSCAHLILRTSWVYGARGKNFFLTILRLAQEKDEIRVVCDQVGSPTWCRFIAETTGEILDQVFSIQEDGFLDHLLEQGGLYNCSSSGQASWFDFATAIIENGRTFPSVAGTIVKPIPSEEFPVHATRPRLSLLDKTKLIDNLMIHPSHWTNQLEDVFGDGNFRLQ